MDQVNILIIGGGVVGCAIAAEVSRRWQDVFVVERLPRVGMATSTRNSGVIHSGIYYPPGSLKARHCLAGNRMTFAFCEKHQVANRKTGKLVVAAEDYAHGKPSPEPYAQALTRLGADPGRSIAIEDATPGILSARAAGARVVGVRAGNFAGLDLSPADLVVDTLSELTDDVCARLVA